MYYKVNSSDCSANLTLEETLVFQFRAYITPLIVIFGVPGNILVTIAFVCMQKKVPCRFNLYVIAISITYNMELIFNAFVDDFLGRGLPWLSNCQIRLKVDTFSNFFCKFITFVPDVASLVSNNVLVLFSFDRVLTIYKPIRFSGNQYRRVTSCGILLIYVFGILLSVPQLVQSSLVEYSNNGSVSKRRCQLTDTSNAWSQYTLYLQIYGTTVIPLLLDLVTNILIFLKLRSIFLERSRLSNNAQNANAELRRVIGHLTLTNIYFCIMLPNVVAITLRQHSDWKGYGKTFPEYAMKMVSLTRLFSSVESIICTTEFPTFLTFLPSFRAELRRFYSSDCLTNSSRSDATTGSYKTHTILSRAGANVGNSERQSLDELTRRSGYERQ